MLLSTFFCFLDLPFVERIVFLWARRSLEFFVFRVPSLDLAGVGQMLGTVVALAFLLWVCQIAYSAKVISACFDLGN